VIMCTLALNFAYQALDWLMINNQSSES